MSCEPKPEEDTVSFLERGIYHSEATGDEIILGDVDAYVRFEGEKRTVVGFDALDNGSLDFSPVEGREDAFNSSSISTSIWTWEPKRIFQKAPEGTVLQSFTLIEP